MARILSIDYGRRRVGLAVTDPLQMLAQPLATIDAAECLDYLQRYVSENPVELIIIGMPVQPSGEPSDAQRFIRPFIGRLKKQLPDMKTEEVDEMYSTVEATRSMIEGGVKRDKRRVGAGIVDRTAAAIILQRYLEQKAR